jgi:PAS domain S-box-containing protein
MTVHPVLATLAVAVFATGCFALVVLTRMALRRREADFRTAELSLEHLITASPVVMFRTDVSFRRTYVSPNAAALLGYGPDQVFDWTWSELVHPDDQQAVFAEARLVTTGAPATFLCRFRHEDGGWRWMHTALRLQRGAAEPFIVGCAFDVTDRVELEANLRDAKDAAEVANAAKSDFLSRMSHELRTPLNSILGFSELLDIEGVTDSQREGVDQIARAGHHLLALINDVLDISRIENDRLGVTVEPVTVAGALADAVDLMEPMAARRGVALIVDEPPPSLAVMADGQRLKQVLLNLLSNAIKYNHPGGTVWIGCRVEGTMVLLDVRDTGRGIAADVRPRLFQAFDRLGAEQSGEDGSGLGLVLSQRLVSAMGGHLDLDRDLAGTDGTDGSRFWFELPLAETVTATVQGAAVGSPVVGPPANGAEGTVLYVEDNASNVELVAHVLRHRPGLRLVSTAQGERALELAAGHCPVAILLDLHLPDISGLDVLGRLRADPRTAAVPVVVITADATLGLEQRVLDAGADAFLTKPVRVGGLLDVLDAVILRTTSYRDPAPGLRSTG